MGRFERDITFLKQNLTPISSSGSIIPFSLISTIGVQIKILDLAGEEYEKLSDNDIKILS